MAAIIIMNKRRRASQQEESNEDLDTDGDGKISANELMSAIETVGVRCDLMVQRLKLEASVAKMMLKLPCFLVGLGCFLVALCEFSPPASVHDVHEHIYNHFGIGNLKDVTEIEHVYDFIESFNHANEKLQATSYVYWCEERYVEHHWDHSIHAPRWTCPSPRMHSLSLVEDDSASWSNRCTGENATNNHCHGAPSGDESADHAGSDVEPDTSTDGHRRLFMRRKLAGSADSHAVQPYPACEDNDTLLQEEEEDNPDITCHHHAAEVCEIDFGILACPLTCGYCAPFTYSHSKLFEKPQVTMLPIVLFQTRFAVMDSCHGFAETYEAQPYNPQLTLLPALDGYRNGKVLTCVDRSQHYEGYYRAEHECPHDGPHVYCDDDGIMRDTRVHYFHGLPVYPKIMIEPARDLEFMKALDWIDLFTEELTVSTMVYTEDVEIFTSASITFTANVAGTVHGRHNLVSYRDLIGGSKTLFILCMLVTSVLAFCGAVISIYEMARHPENCKWGYQLYELASRCILLSYPLVLLVSWTQQIPMAEEYDHLLHSFIDTPGISQDDMEVILDSYFDVKTHMYEETTWLMNHRCAAYIVLYVQFVQLIFYFSLHPKMAVLTDTIFKAFWNILHFLALFTILFLMLAFMAHWMLGEHITEFGTFGKTLETQAQMIYGEFIYAEEAEYLYDSHVVMYWLYAITFMLVIYFTLLNFFLAIIVDAFADVKKKNEALHTVHTFAYDIVELWATMLQSHRHRWPKRQALSDFFQAFISEEEKTRLKELKTGKKVQPKDKKPICHPEDLTLAFPKEFPTLLSTAELLSWYNMQCEEILCHRHDEECEHGLGIDVETGPREHTNGAREHTNGARENMNGSPEHTNGAGMVRIVEEPTLTPSIGLEGVPWKPHGPNETMKGFSVVR
mmetsp:Transcript_49377/g.115461  ORF Transcript_49377/g.115461 Transcript_49377/m.115461 type:complete len:905 (-) Transcript_49377:40-2754(-)